MKESIYPGTWSKSKDFISIPRKMEPSSCSVILDSCACLTMIKDIKSTKMTCQDNKRGFLGDQHLSSELLLLSVVFLFLSEIAPSNKDYIFFSVSHASFFFFSFSLNIELLHCKTLYIQRGKWEKWLVIRDLTNCPFSLNENPKPMCAKCL